MNLTRAPHNIPFLLQALFGLALLPGVVSATCSPYIGQATINEISREGNASRPSTDSDFVEIRLLNTSLPTATLKSWFLKICFDEVTGNGGNEAHNIRCHKDSMSNADDSTSPWWVYYNQSDPSDFPSSFIGYNDGFYIELLDENNELVDILVHNPSAYIPTTSTTSDYESCDFRFNTASPGSSGNGQRRLYRDDDGLGDWIANPGDSGNPTTGTSNNGTDTAIPDLTISSTDASPGSDARVTFTISTATDLEIYYSTQDHTAEAGQDYQAQDASATLTLSGGETEVSVQVPILNGATPTQDFYVWLDSASETVNILNNLTTVTILSEPVAAQVHHYELERNLDQGLTCEPLIIKSRACLNEDCSEQADGTITTEFSPSSGWVGSNTQTYSSDDSLAFQLTSPSDMTLGVNSSTPDFDPMVTDERVRCYVGTVLKADCKVQFVDTDLRFFDSGSVTSSPILDLKAGQVSSFDMRLVATDETTGRCETQLLDSDRFTTTIGTQCETPNTCLADQQVIWDQTSAASISLPNPQDRVGGSATISAQIAFDSQGDAPFELSAPDVGVQSLNVNLTLLDVDGGGTNKLIEGSVNLRVRPASLVLSAVEVGDTHIAGQPFDVTIQALGVNTDGTTYVVPSFGRIGDSYTVNWSQSTLALPTATAASTVIPVIGTLAGATTPDDYTDTDPGSRKESITFSSANGLAYLEVGAVNLVAQIENYLGSNESVQSPNPGSLVGSFIPEFLTATQVGLAAWGSDVSFYQGQAKSLEGFEYEVMAYAKDGIVPLNYYEGAGLLAAFNDSKVVHVISGTSVDLVGDLVWTMSGDEDFDGTMRLSGNATTLTWPRPNIPTATDILRSISSFQLDATTLGDGDEVCIAAIDDDRTLWDCMALLTVELQVARSLQYVRAALPAQVDADTDNDTDTMTAFVEVILEALDSIDTDGNPVFVPQSIDSALDETIFEGLDFDATLHACTLEGTGTCSDIASSSIFTGPDGTGNALDMGLGLIEASSSTSGLMGARLNAPDWLSWNWDGDADGTLELASTLLIFGEFQGRTPLLFVRPMFR